MKVHFQLGSSAKKNLKIEANSTDRFTKWSDGIYCCLVKLKKSLSMSVETNGIDFSRWLLAMTFLNKFWKITPDKKLRLFNH